MLFAHMFEPLPGHVDIFALRHCSVSEEAPFLPHPAFSRHKLYEYRLNLQSFNVCTSGGVLLSHLNSPHSVAPIRFFTPHSLDQLPVY